MELNASIIALVEEAHADTVVKLGPLNLYLIDICPAGMSEINLGIKKGL